jgi:hypothetical protein
MTDAEFLSALETCTLPQSDFGHSAHVRAAYLYLRAEGFSGALERTRRAIRAYALHLGKSGLYHETITVAYLALIQQHMFQRGDGRDGGDGGEGEGGGWAAFERDNPELFRPGLLLDYYPKAQLESDLARRVFVLPGASP